MGSYSLQTHRFGAHRKFIPLFVLKKLKLKFWPYVPNILQKYNINHLLSNSNGTYRIHVKSHNKVILFMNIFSFSPSFSFCSQFLCDDVITHQLSDCDESKVILIRISMALDETSRIHEKLQNKTILFTDIFPFSFYCWWYISNLNFHIAFTRSGHPPFRPQFGRF